MATITKAKRIVKTANSAAKPEAKATVTITKKATVTTGEAKAVAAAITQQANNKFAELNKAFLSKHNKRPVFGEKRPTPVDYSKHNPVSPTDRDNAFVYAIRAVYGDKPFSAADLRADTGNIARAVKLNLMQALGVIDGAETFKLVSNQA